MERLTDFDRRKNIEESCNIWNKLKNKNKIVDVIINLKNEITGLTIKNEKLENQQKQLAIEELKKLKQFLANDLMSERTDFTNSYIDKRIKELKG